MSAFSVLFCMVWPQAYQLTRLQLHPQACVVWASNGKACLRHIDTRLEAPYSTARAGDSRKPNIRLGRSGTSYPDARSFGVRLVGGALGGFNFRKQLITWHNCLLVDAANMTVPRAALRFPIIQIAVTLNSGREQMCSDLPGSDHDRTALS